MGCFDNLVTVKGTCNDEVSESGITLLDVGISNAELNDYITEDYASGAELGESKIDFARKIMVAEIYKHFQDKFIARSIIDGQVIGHQSDNMTAIAGVANTLKGLEIKSCNEDSYTALYISSISLFTNYTGDIDVFVYDLKQNKLLDTITVTTVAGQISKKFINKTYDSGRLNMDLIFVYDSTGISSYKTYPKHNGCTDCNSDGTSFLNRYLKAGGVSILSANDKIKSNLTYQDDCAGMSITYSINCDYENWLCTIKHLVALPLAYKAAELIMEYALHSSDRVNSRKILNTETIEARRQHYQTKYFESKNSLIKNMKLPTDSKCFKCREAVRTVTILP